MIYKHIYNPGAAYLKHEQGLSKTPCLCRKETNKRSSSRCGQQPAGLAGCRLTPGTPGVSETSRKHTRIINSSQDMWLGAPKKRPNYRGNADSQQNQ